MTKGLSEREGEILRLVATGLDNATIGRHLYLAEDTVKTHLRAVYGKLGVEGPNARLCAVVAAHRRGMLDLNKLEEAP